MRDLHTWERFRTAYANRKYAGGPREEPADDGERTLLEKVLAGLKAKQVKAGAGTRKSVPTNDVRWKSLPTPVSTAPKWLADDNEKMRRLMSRMDDLDGVCS